MSANSKTIHDVLGRYPVHPFPARMAPGIALEAIAQPNRPLRVLDPMMGSGTVPAVARSSGHQAFGVDVDPLAVLIARVWTTAIDRDKVRDKAEEVLERAKCLFPWLALRDAYPHGADEETKRFVTYWFDDYVRRQLSALATAIRRVHDEDVRAVLWCSFSRLIISKQAGASRALDLSHSRPHLHYDRGPEKPFRNFLSAVERVVTNCIDKRERGRGPAPSLRSGDARDLPFPSSSIDLVVTSPPYLNAIDYFRCSKFSLVWMGHSIKELRALRSVSVGTEVGQGGRNPPAEVRAIIAALKVRPRLAPRAEAILSKFITDMSASVAEAARVLAPTGRAVYVVGENVVRGSYIRNSKIVSMVAERAGLKQVDRRYRALPANRRYLPPPAACGGSETLNTRMRREVVLTFSKPA